MKTKYHSSIQKGNTGENYVAYLLSTFCIVRPVASGTDIGIDIYCELPIFNQKGELISYLHFGVQVKTGKSYEKGISMSKYLDYYEELQFPILLARVLNPEKIEESVLSLEMLDYTKSIIDKNEGTESLDQLKRPTYGYEDFATLDELEIFVRKAVELSTVRLGYRDGILRPLPSSKYEYFQNYSHYGSFNYAAKAYRTLTKTCSNMILSYFDREDIPDSVCSEISRLVPILEAANDADHWESMYALARYYHATKDFDKAEAYYNKSKGVIERDPQTKEGKLKDFFNRIEAIIRRNIQYVKNKERLSKEYLVDVPYES